MADFHPENQVIYSEEGYKTLNQFLSENSFSKLFLLVDSNTHDNCLSHVLKKLETTIPMEVIELEPGEEHKSIDTCNGVWETMSDLGGDRKSLLINIGGGVITDLGGFVASTFKRGISFVHIPTTLLSMVDASIGGKNGVNLGALKNQIGVICPPELVIIDTSLLKTLPPAEMRSGLAEMLKHGLIQDVKYWNALKDLGKLDISQLNALVKTSVEIKSRVVQQDPREKHLRKSLNFGHTLGHAIESYMLEPGKKKLLHGEAVAVGMILACFLSFKLEDFPEDDLHEIKKVLISMYGQHTFSKLDQEKIIDLLKFDKKNEAGKINFVLLRRIGEPVMDRQVPNDLIYDAFAYYAD